MWRVSCVSGRPSLKISASGWIEGSGSDFPRKWEEETCGLRPLCARAARRLTGERERERGGRGEGWRVDRKRDTASPLWQVDGKRVDIQSGGRRTFGQRFWVLDWRGDEASARGSEFSALLLTVLLTHFRSYWEERLPQHQVHFSLSLTRVTFYCFWVMTLRLFTSLEMKTPRERECLKHLHLSECRTVLSASLSPYTLLFLFVFVVAPFWLQWHRRFWLLIL